MLIYLENKHEYSYVAREINNFIERRKKMFNKQEKEQMFNKILDLPDRIIFIH